MRTKRGTGAWALLAPVCLLAAGCSGESPGGFTDFQDPPSCKGVVCEAMDDCHDPGACDAKTGKCTTPAKADGTACTDDDRCTTEDACVAGECRGTPYVCKALNDCHNPGLCNPRTGECTNVPKADGSACDDDNACTQLDSCVYGLCRGGQPVVCEEADACHDPGVCDPATGRCSQREKPDGSSCDDGDGCTDGDTCNGGTCRAGGPRECTVTDDCHNPGLCNPRTGACSEREKADGSACDDGNPCTSLDSCQAGKCTGGTPRSCPAGDACNEASACNPSTGQCEAVPRADGTACNDGNACTRNDACQAGVCTGTNPVACAASDDCHLPGSCDIVTGACSNPAKPNGSICSDGNACTQTDTCQGGVCTGGNAVACGSSGDCRGAGTCNPSTGLCSSPAGPDGEFCTEARDCASGLAACSGGNCAASGCFADSADRCTLSTVDPVTGAVSKRPRRCPPVFLDPETGAPNHCLVLDTTKGALVDAACNPSQSSCPRTGCIPATGVCEYRPRACGATPCAPQACEPSTGECTTSPVGCGALVPDTCHVLSSSLPDGCDANAGCVFDAVVCPAPADGCSEYVQVPRPGASTAPCCELADRCARLSDVTGTVHVCSNGDCVASQ